jgi:single-strand DNA-binding protein
MANYNKVILAANLVSDPELKNVGDSNVVRFRVAINRKFTTKSGEKKEESTYIDCEMWGARASIISEYMTKGDPILIDGILKQENWETKDGEKRSKHIISIQDFEFMSNKKTAATSSSSNPVVKENKRPTREAVAQLEDIPF